MGKTVKTILFLFAGLMGLGTLALVLVGIQQQSLLRALIVRQTEILARSESETRRSLASLSDRMDLLASSNSGTQGAVKRLQRRFSDDFSTIRGSLDEVAGALREREIAKAAAAARSAGAPSTPAAAPLAPAPAVAASPVPLLAPGDSPEKDLPLSQALQRGKAFFAKGEFVESSLTLSPFLQSKGKNPELRLYLAASRFHANPSDSSQYAGIEQDLRAVLAENPDSPLALKSMGWLCMEQGRWTEALQWLSQAVVLQPADVDLLEKAGRCAVAAGALPEAEAYLDKAAALRPADADLWYASGCAFASAGDHGEAYARFEKCLALQPLHQGARGGAVRCLNELGRYAEATALADSARSPGVPQEQ